MNDPLPPVHDEDFALGLRALGHPVRLSILRILGRGGDGDCCCTDVTQCLPLAQSTVSQHIKVLLDAGLIERHARGTRNCYSVRKDRLGALEDALGGLFAEIVPEGERSNATLARLDKEPAS